MKYRVAFSGEIVVEATGIGDAGMTVLTALERFEIKGVRAEELDVDAHATGEGD
ncbi:MAG: hypothetical protein ACYC5N_08150 [Endomicrobiales bacterium]